MPKSRQKVNILGVSLSPKKDDDGEEVLDLVLDSSEEIENAQTDYTFLADKDFIGCIHCNWCVESQEEGVYCSIDDDLQDIYPKVLEADALVIGTPKNLAKMTWKWKPFLDRLRVFIEGRLYGLGSPRGVEVFGKVATSTSFIWPEYGVENTTIQMISPFLLMGMLPVGPLSSNFKTADSLRVSSKRELIKRAKQLGKRVARITKYLKAGGELKREMPAYVEGR